MYIKRGRGRFCELFKRLKEGAHPFFYFHQVKRIASFSNYLSLSSFTYIHIYIYLSLILPFQHNVSALDTVAAICGLLNGDCSLCFESPTNAVGDCTYCLNGSHAGCMPGPRHSQNGALLCASGGGFWMSSRNNTCGERVRGCQYKSMTA